MYAGTGKQTVVWRCQRSFYVKDDCCSTETRASKQNVMLKLCSVCGRVGVLLTDTPALALCFNSLHLCLPPSTSFFHTPLHRASAGVRVAGWQPCRSPHYAASELVEIYRDDKSSLEGNNDHRLWCRRRKEGRGSGLSGRSLCIWSFIKWNSRKFASVFAEYIRALSLCIFYLFYWCSSRCSVSMTQAMEPCSLCSPYSCVLLAFKRYSSYMPVKFCNIWICFFFFFSNKIRHVLNESAN